MRFRILQAGILLLLASSANSTGLIDRMHSIAEQAWEDEYIPDSGIPATPLTDYDNFEVTELFRAVTIEDLEAAITGGYPMAWLEETLKDETIPWEDRYWLDRRVRAAIAQNTHTFFNPAGSPVHIDADAVFPGELYWREHMIVDPAGWNVPEGAERPVAVAYWDIGHILNPFGNKVGDLPFPVPQTVMSRDGKISVMSTGGTSPDHPREQPYACFMYPDGTFREIPLGELGVYSATVSQDGSVAVFSCTERFHLSSEERTNSPGPVYIFDSNGNLQRSVIPQTPLQWCWRPTISSDGNYLCHMAYGANTCLIDCLNGTYEIVSKPSAVYNRCNGRYLYSSNPSILTLSNLAQNHTISLNAETHLVDSNENVSTRICSSNDLICTTLTRRRGYKPAYHHELLVYVENNKIYSNRIPPEGDTVSADKISFITTEVSPNGNFLFTNPIDAFCGYPSSHGYSEVYNLPLIVMQIEGR